MVVFGWLLLGQVLAAIVASLIYEGDLMEALSDPVGHPDVRYVILISQAVAATVGFILVPWMYLKFYEQRNLTIFFKSERQWPMIALLLLVLVMSLGVAISPLVEWNANIQFPDWLASFGEYARNLEELAAKTIKVITTDLTVLSFTFIFLVVAVLPGIGEELVFRGFLQTELVRALRNPHVAILITSVLFSAFHLQFFGFVPRILLSVCFGYLYYWSGNLWVPVLAHLFNNGLQLIGLYLYQKGLITIDMESTQSAPLPTVAVSIVALGALLYYLRHYFITSATLHRDRS